MAVTLETATRNAMASAIATAVDAGAAGGKLVLRDSTTVLATVTLHTTAFGSPATGVITAIGGDNTNPVSGGNPRTFTGSGDGDADNFQLTDSDDTLVLSGSVTATGGGGDVTLDNVSIATSQNGNLNTFTITVPAS